MSILDWKVSSVGTANGKPAVEYWRHGSAARGEPRIVTKVAIFENETARDNAVFVNKTA